MLTWPALRERMRLNWRLSPDDLDAALLLGLPHIAPPADLSPAAPILAAETAEWAAAYLRGDSADSLLLRRRLFRAVYCDWPDLSHVLRLLAAHHARLFFGHDDPHLVEQTRAAYVPAARMLGLWRVQRCWFEEVARRANPGKYVAAVERFGVDSWADYGRDSGIALEFGADMLEDHLVASRQTWEQAQTGDVDDKLPKAGRFDLDSRMRVFNRLRRELDAALAVEFPNGPCPSLELLPLMPGVTIGYAREEKLGLDDWLRQLPQLHLRLFCASELDCYRALGVFHRVAQPIRPGADTRFRDFTDHIARPQPNGYRALQTTCQWPREADVRLVRCHVLTRKMHDLNEWGVMSAAANDDGARPGLWRSMERVSNSLKQRGDGDVGDYLRRHDFDADPEPTYCFTPLGEIVLLDRGSLPLDFAYRVHTELGHQAARIDVNGRPADLNAPLRNGDLVRVTLDPSTAPLNFDWQGKVRHYKSRRVIRAELRYRAANIHSGRGKFEAELIHLIDIYRRDVRERIARKQDEDQDLNAVDALIPASADIEHFLRRSALRLGFGVPQRLYEQMDADDRLVGNLAHRLISEKIIRALRPVDGRTAIRPPSDIRLCASCRPTGNPIRVLRQSDDREGDILLIHRPGCHLISLNAPEIGLEWADQDTPDDWPLYRFDIGAPDDDGLLIRLLEIVRAMPNTYLFRADASVNERHRAYIMLDVALRLPQLRGDLKHLLEQTGAEVNYDYLPAERRRSDVRVADLSREMTNPFTRGHVTDWRFFDRDEVTTRLTRWLYREAAKTPVMLVFGQRRVGKSSLVNRFFEKERLVEYPDRRVVPVYVDFRLPNLSRPETVAHYLGQCIDAELGLNYAPPRPDEDSLVWLNGLLLAAEAHLRDARLLIIIDEFDADLDRLWVAEDRQAPERRPRSLAALQAIMGTHSFIRWLLVVQDIYLADPRVRATLPDLPYSFTQLEVRHLETPHARNLIRTLMTQSGYRTRSGGLFDQVVDWSAGNPFFIHLLGRELINSADAGGRKQITEADFFQAINVVLGRDGEFSHFAEHLAPDSPRRAVATFVAAACEPGDSLPLPAVVEEMVHRRGLMSLADTRRTIAVLERLGVLATTRDAPDGRVTIPVRLFHQWLKVTWES